MSTEDHVDKSPPPPPVEHRWSGWPGAWCLDCGIEDPSEHCLANHDHGCDGNGYPLIPRSCMGDACPEPGSRRHDPYAKGVP